MDQERAAMNLFFLYHKDTEYPLPHISGKVSIHTGNFKEQGNNDKWMSLKQEEKLQQ